MLAGKRSNMILDYTFDTEKELWYEKSTQNYKFSFKNESFWIEGANFWLDSV
jgi:hypothetical protein